MEIFKTLKELMDSTDSVYGIDLNQFKGKWYLDKKGEFRKFRISKSAEDELYGIFAKYLGVSKSKLKKCQNQGVFGIIRYRKYGKVVLSIKSKKAKTTIISKIEE